MYMVPVMKRMGVFSTMVPKALLEGLGNKLARNTLFSKMTGYRLDKHELLPRNRSDFCLHCHIQTCFGTHMFIILSGGFTQ